jgi:glycosyltransferase involved in cell wall biosynthesis
MKLGIDASNLRQGGGITHLTELLKVARPEQYGFSRVIIWTDGSLAAHLPTAPWLEIVREPLLEKQLPLRIFWQQQMLPKLARQSCDVLFAPGGLSGRGFHPLVTMSRNMLPFDEGEMRRYGCSRVHLRLRLLRYSQTRSLRRADGIIFLTEYARSVVMEQVGKVAGEAAIIPHGVSHHFRQTPRAQKPVSEYSADRPFRLLYVSIVDAYKHQWEVVEAVARLREKNLPVTLDIIGGVADKASGQRLEAAMTKANALTEHAYYRGAVSFAQLPDWYKQADAFVFASSCENRPNILIEAMAAGLPIACSRRGPMPEVLGDAGAYFDPERPGEIAAALELMIRNPDFRESIAEAAYNRAGKFSWEECADRTLAFIAGIARRSRNNGNSS